MSKKTKGSKKPKKETKKMSTATKVEIASTKKTSAESVALKPKGRASRFMPTIDEARKLKVGEALEVSLDKTDGAALQNTRNWLANLIRTHIEAPKGSRVVVRTTADSKLAIICEKHPL